MIILGISAYYHDSAAAILVDGEIVAAAQEERFTRIKHTADFPLLSIKYCLQQAKINLLQIDAIVFYDKPFLKFERLLETYMNFAPKGLISFIKAMPVWLSEKLFLKNRIRNELKKLEGYKNAKFELLFSEHHLSHAASAYFVSPYKEAAILTVDGVGEWCTTSIGIAHGNKITFLREMHFPNSVGLFYSAFTYYLGFKVNSGEYKLMGLAPYGNKDSKEVKSFVELIKTHLVDIKLDGSIFLRQAYFNYSTGLTMTKNKKWEALFGFKRRGEGDELKQHHCNLALAAQLVTEEIVLKLAAEAKRLTQLNYLCMAGGVALNCVANSKLLQSELFKEIYVQPAAGDAGAALGAALGVYHIYFDKPKLKEKGMDTMKGSYLGPEYGEEELEDLCKRSKAIAKKYSDSEQLSNFVASEIANGKVVGWFQGRMEFGPRALGNRSILADPRNNEMQKKLNLKIKYREGFRPFAPAVLEEHILDFFETTNTNLPYMLFTAPLKSSVRKTLPQNYSYMNMVDKLYFRKSDLPAITHVDFSARVQTVSNRTNPLFHKLISAFYQLTKTPVIINTSFNLRGEPVVCTPYEAYRCFMATEMDLLVVNNYVFLKSEQPGWQNKESWLTELKTD